MYHTRISATALSAVFSAFVLFFAASALAQDGFGRDGFPLPDAPQATSEGSNCFFANGGLGCDDDECEATVCGQDSFCCDVAWDGICSDAAIELCPVDVESDVSRAQFEVNKNFTDDNPEPVLVTINCFTGLPLEQSQWISEDQNVTFVVTDFDDDELDCEISESVPDGYSAYHNAVPGSDGDQCTFSNVGWGQFARCDITNEPDPVTVTVYKEWIYTNTESGNEVDDSYQITLYCNAEIQGGYDLGNGNWRSKQSGSGEGSFTWWVEVTYQGATCSAEESLYDGAVESDSGDCDNLLIDVGQGAECSIVNTVFYEGIPTLGQYGMVLLALLMLAVGVIGFRRFV